MESRTTRECEWCKKPLVADPAAAQPSGPTAQPLTGPPPVVPLLNNDVTQQMPPLGATSPAPQPTRVMRTTLTGETIEVTQAMSPPQYPAPPGAHSAANSVPTYPPAQAVVAGTRTSGAVRDRHGAQQEIHNASIGERFELFLAISLPILLGSVYLVHAMPGLLIYVMMGNLFLLSLVLGATGAIPGYDDAATEIRPVVVILGVLFVVFLFIGSPFSGLNGAYLNLVWVGLALFVAAISGLFQQEWNTAVIGLLALDLVVDVCLTRATLAGGVKLPLMTYLAWGPLGRIFAAFLGMGGWILSNFLRPVEAA
jgi:hypothetical protein